MPGFDPRFSNRLIPCNPLEVEGMRTLYADRSETYGVRYAHDVVYDERSGMKLHMQMLYPGLLFPNVPDGLMKRMFMQRALEDVKSGNAPKGPGPAMPKFDPKDLPEPKYVPIAKVGSQKRFPCVLFIKGSGWGKQDCYVELPMLIDICRAGFVVAAVEYRPVDVEPFPGFVSDVKSAIRFLRANCDDFDIDPNRIGILGDSSGGHTSMMIGSTGWMRDFDLGDNLEYSSEVQACVEWYGVADFTRYREDGANPRPFLTKRILGEEGAKRPDAWEYISPVTYIKEENEYPPFLCMHGDRDVTVEYEQSVVMYNKLRECGKRAEFIKVQGANHGQYFWTKEVIQATIDFLKAYL